MSYCRFGSDDFQSDVYVWGDGRSWNVCCAANKRDFNPLDLPPPLHFGNDCSKWTDEQWEQEYERDEKVMEIVKKAPFVEITLPHAGKLFAEKTRTAAVKRLEKLRKIGYRVPKRAIERLLEEEQEELKGGKK